MSSEGVMKNRLGSTWMVLTGVLLTASVCDADCIKHNFKEHITDNLLVDHWFQLKNFTPPGEPVLLQHEFLSVLNTICSSLIANQQYITSQLLNGTSQSKVVWTYIQMIKALAAGAKMRSVNETVQFCLIESCSQFYSTTFINTTQFERIYKKVCVLSQTAACPPPQKLSAPKSTTTFQPDLQTSSALTNGSSSSGWSDSQSHLVVSTAVPTIIIIIIISVTLIVCYRCKNPRCQQDFEEAPQSQNSTNPTQVQSHMEFHEEDVGEEFILQTIKSRDDDDDEDDDHQ